MFNSIFCLAVSMDYSLKDSVKPLGFVFPAVNIRKQNIIIINTNNLITLELYYKFSNDIPAGVL